MPKLKMVKVDQVQAAYNGARGCMCGCKGSYAYASAHREEAGANRGYEVGAEDVADSKVRARVNQVNRLIASGDYDELEFSREYGSTHVYLERPGRVTCLYFTKAA